jgi:hypothetical protein
LDFFQKNSEAILTILFYRAYIPNAKGLGEIAAINDFFERATEGIVEYRKINETRQKADPNLVLRALFLSVLANSIFRDVIFPLWIASEGEINEAVTTAIIEGLSAFSTR